MKKPSERTILLIILIFAFLLRVWGIGHGLPLFLHLDENTIGGTVMKMIKTSDLNPHYFRYPSLYLYFIYLIISSFGLIIGNDFSVANNMTAFYLVGRFSTAIISTATVYLTYLLGKAFFSQKISFLAATVFSVIFLPVYLSHFMTIDMLALFFLLISLIFCFKIAQEGRVKDYLLAGLFSGFLIGTKFNVVIILPLVFAHFFPIKKSKKRPFLQLVAAFLIIALAFLLTNPYFVSDWKNYASGVWSQIMLQKGEEVAMMSDRDGIHSWWWYWQYWFHSGVGFAVTLFSLLGVFISALNIRENSKKFFLFILFPAFYLVIISLSHHRGDRYSLPLMPFFAIFSGLFLEKVMDFFEKTIHHFKVRLAAFFFFLLIFLGPLIYKAIVFDYSISQKDTRLLAGEWIEENYPKDQLVFAIADATQTGQYLQKKNFNRIINLFHMKIEETFLYPDELFLISSADCHFAKNYKSIPEYERFLENYKLIKENGELVKEFSQPLFKGEFFSPSFLEHSSTVNAYHHPTVEIYKIPYLPELYKDEIDFEYKPEEMKSNMILKEQNGKKYLWADGKKVRFIAGPHLLFPKGSYVLEYEIKDLTCLEPQAKMAIMVISSGGRTKIAEKNFSCYQLLGYNKVTLDFNLEKTSRLELFFRGDKGASFLVKGAYLQGEVSRP